MRVERPFPEYAVPRVWEWMREFRWRVSDDFGPKTLDEFMDRWSSAALTWGVWRGEELGGLVTVEPVSPVLASSHCVFKKSFWGRDTTLAALRKVYAEVFASGVLKIASLVFRDNKQMVGLARELGAAREGVLRHQTMRQGRPVDMVAMGLLVEDFKDGNRGNSSVADGGDGGRLGGVGSTGQPEECPDKHEHVEDEQFVRQPKQARTAA